MEAVFRLIGGFFLVELVGGLLTNSLALLSDAGHMFTDLLGMGMALVAIQAASTLRAYPQRSSGLYRFEILAALANAALRTAVAGYVIYESIRRLAEPPGVLGMPMLIVGTLGLLVNVVAFLLVRDGKGASLEVIADLLASVGVVTAAAILLTTGFTRADPIVAIGIGLFILPRAWKLRGKALRVLIEAAPAEIDVAGLNTELTRLDGAADVHDLRVWTLTSGMDVASVHLRLQPGTDSLDTLDQARALLRNGHGIEYATIQVEPDEHHACDDQGETSW